MGNAPLHPYSPTPSSTPTRSQIISRLDAFVARRAERALARDIAALRQRYPNMDEQYVRLHAQLVTTWNPYILPRLTELDSPDTSSLMQLLSSDTATSGPESTPANHPNSPASSLPGSNPLTDVTNTPHLLNEAVDGALKNLANVLDLNNDENAGLVACFEDTINAAAVSPADDTTEITNPEPEDDEPRVRYDPASLRSEGQPGFQLRCLVSQCMWTVKHSNELLSHMAEHFPLADALPDPLPRCVECRVTFSNRVKHAAHVYVTHYRPVPAMENLQWLYDTSTVPGLCLLRGADFRRLLIPLSRLFKKANGTPKIELHEPLSWDNKTGPKPVAGPGNGAVPCPVKTCKLFFGNELDRLHHMNLHFDVAPWQCIECGAFRPSYARFWEHVVKRHKVALNDASVQALCYVPWLREARYARYLDVPEKGDRLYNWVVHMHLVTGRRVPGFESCVALRTSVPYFRDLAIVPA